MRNEILFAVMRGWPFLDPQQDEGQSAVVADETTAFRYIGLGVDDVYDRKATAGRDDIEANAQAGMAFLVAGLTVMTIVHTDDGEVRRVLQRDRRQRAHV